MPELNLPHPPFSITTREVVIARMSSGGYDPNTINESLILQNARSLRTDKALLTLPDPSRLMSGL